MVTNVLVASAVFYDTPGNLVTEEDISVGLLYPRISVIRKFFSDTLLEPYVYMRTRCTGDTIVGTC